MPKSTLLPSIWDVPNSIRNRLGTRSGRQRAMLAEGHLLLILHAPPKTDEEVRAGRYFWRAPDGTWRATEHGSGIAALQQHLKDFREAIDKLDTAEEQASDAGGYFRVLRELTPLRRTVRNLHNTLQQARELVPDDQALISARDEAYVLDREAELLQVDARNAQDYYVARQAEKQALQSHQMALASHRLNVLVAIFFPLATLGTLLGMNVRNGLEESPPPLAFIAVLVVGLFLGLLVRGAFFGPRRPPGEGAA